MTNLQWIAIVISLVLGTALPFLVLALAFSPEPPEDSPYA